MDDNTRAPLGTTYCIQIFKSLSETFDLFNGHATGTTPKAAWLLLQAQLVAHVTPPLNQTR